MARTLVLALLIAVVLGAAPRDAWATCNVIPGATDIFRGALGSTDRPFAMPGDVVEVSLQPKICDGESSTALIQLGGATPADDYRVTVLFVPPQGRRNAVILATDCTGLGPGSDPIDTCNGQLDVGAPESGGQAQCVLVNTPPGGIPGGVTIADALHLAFRFPDTDFHPGSDTPVLEDNHTLAGPAKIVVTRASSALPCYLANQRCAMATGLVACVDELFQQDGSCRTEVNDVDALFGHFTALPPPNDFSALVAETATARFTIDAAGHALVPMNWQAVLRWQGDVPFPRLVRGGTSVESFKLGGNAIDLPSDRFIGSFSPEGIPLPPIFQPISDPNATGQATLFGATDAPLGVLRVARRLPVVASCNGGANDGSPCDLATDCPDASCVELSAFEYRQCTDSVDRPCLQDSDCGTDESCGMATCQGGANDGQSCSTDAQCPGGECGPSLFDFADRFDPGVGPVLITNNLYSAEDETAVTLDAQRQTPDLFAFVVPEGLEDENLNGDGDLTPNDLVVVLRNRTTGEVQPTGPGGARGHPGVPVLDPLPLRPRSVSLATEGKIAAFLRSEPLQGACTTTPLFCDANGDGDSMDGLLTVLRILPTGPEDLTPTPAVAADPSLEIDGQNVAVSDGLVFFRTAEADAVGRGTVLVSVSSGGAQANAAVGNSGVISPDGRYVAFTSAASNLDSTPPDTNGAADVFVHDRDADGDEIFDSEDGIVDPGEIATERVSLTTGGDEVAAGGGSGLWMGVTLTANGRFVGFNSSGAFVPGDTNGLRDAYVRDRDTDQTVLVSALPSGLSANGAPNLAPSVTPDGRYVAFESDATNLVAGDTNGVRDIFVRDRDTDENGMLDEPNFVSVVRVSVAGDGTQADGLATSPEISDDGRYVAFESDATNLIPDDPGDPDDGDQNAVRDVFVHDRDADANGSFDEPGAVATVRVSVSTAGAEGNDMSPPILLRPSFFSASGRLVYFDSGATYLVAGDTNGLIDAFVRDRDTDQDGVMDEPGAVATRRVSVRSDGTQGSSHAFAFGTDDGRFCAFLQNTAGGFDDGPTNGLFLHDLASGATQRVSIANGIDFPAVVGFGGGLSQDARHVLFSSNENLAPGASGSLTKAYVRGIDPSSCAPDLSGDCDFADTVLRVLDTNEQSPAPMTLGPAGQVSVEGGNATWLDETDGTVMLWRRDPLPNPLPGTMADLGRIARQVELSPSWIAALVSEEGASLNGDADQSDLVVQMNAVSTATSGTWVTTISQAADRLELAGALAAFRTPEADQGNLGTDGTADGDVADGFVQLYDAAGAGLVPVVDPQCRQPDGSFADCGSGSAQTRRQPAEDLVLGGDVLAFRVREGSLCDADLGAVTAVNCDDVSPPGCSDRAQCNLNGDSDCCDDVLQAWDAANGVLVNSQRTVVPCTLAACDARTPYKVVGRTVRFLEHEAQQMEDLNGDGDDLPPLTPNDLVVQVLELDSGVVETAGAVLPDDPDAPAQGPDPLDPGDAGELGQAGGTVFVATGRCVETTAPDCAACSDNGQFCEEGVCKRDHGTCRTDADCPFEVACTRTETYTAAAADVDGDSIPDPVDNCAHDANADQADADGDGVGDACDVETCGNALVEVTEECDDGRHCESGSVCTEHSECAGVGDEQCLPRSSDGCSAACRIENGPCDDSLDNDGDGLADLGADPGCQTASSARENPKCDDDADNDGDGGIDWDGGPSQGVADPQCVGRPWRNKETPDRNCGLGAELVLLVFGFVAARRRLRRWRPRQVATP